MTEDDIDEGDLVVCLDCAHLQPNMGVGVVCEVCGGSFLEPVGDDDDE